MKNNTKWRTEGLAFYDSTGIQARLEKMAAKGWQLEKISTLGWFYRRCNPSDLHYSVVYRPSASEYDFMPTDNEVDFREYCARAGWKFVTTFGQMAVYCNEQENPVPIETDAQTQVEIVHRTMKRGFLSSRALMLLVGVLNLFALSLRFFANPIYVLTDSLSLAAAVGFVLLILSNLMDIVGYSLWHKKAVKYAQHGEFLPTKGNSQRILLFGFIGLILLMLVDTSDKLFWLIGVLCVTAVVVVVNLVKALLRRKQVKASVSRALVTGLSVVLSFVLVGGVTAVVLTSQRSGTTTYIHNGLEFVEYHDILPLTIEDIKNVDYDEYSYRLDVARSLFATSLEAVQRPRVYAQDVPSLSYTVTTVNPSFLQEFCWENLVGSYRKKEHYELVAVAPEVWGAQEVIEVRYADGFTLKEYLLRYPDRIVTFNPDWQLTQEEMRRAVAGCSADTLT